MSNKTYVKFKERKYNIIYDIWILKYEEKGSLTKLDYDILIKWFYKMNTLSDNISIFKNTTNDNIFKIVSKRKDNTLKIIEFEFINADEMLETNEMSVNNE